MKLLIPAPVIALGSPYSLLDMARHVTSTDARYNRSAEAARSGVRLVAAIESAKGGTADVTEEDLRLFAEVVDRPNRGWGAHSVQQEIPDPRSGGVRKYERKAPAPTATYLPLIDAVTEAARALPPIQA